MQDWRCAAQGIMTAKRNYHCREGTSIIIHMLQWLLTILTNATFEMQRIGLVSVGRRSVSPVHYKHCSGTSWITFCGSITRDHVEMLNQISCGTASVFWSSTQWGVNMLHNWSGSDWKHSRCPISNVSAGYYQLWGGAEGGVRAEPVFYAEINVASHWARTPATPACRSCTS